MNNLSFKFCPVCGEELHTGKLQLPAEKTVYNKQLVWWYSDETMEKLKDDSMKKTSLSFAIGNDKTTAVKKKPCIPSGYCKKCDRVFAEFEIRDWDNPIG